MAGRIVLTKSQATELGFDLPDGDGNPAVPSGESAGIINLVAMPDNEKLIFFEGFCYKCQNPAMHIFSSRNRRFICTGCGKRVHSYKLGERLWDRVANLVTRSKSKEISRGE